MRSLIGFSAVALSMVVIAGVGAVLRPITSTPVAYDVTDFGSFAIANDVANDAAMDLKGLWSRHPDGTGRDDEPMAFYYFHTGGVGLYRYGQVGHNTTNSYTWRVDHDDRALALQLLQIRDRCHRGHRSFRLARLTSARRMEMIQKRTMIFGSGHPYFS